MSYEKLDEIRKTKIPILRHVWVFKVKRDDDGKYSVHMVRGNVDGSMQKLGIAYNYNETFAPGYMQRRYSQIVACVISKL